MKEIRITKDVKIDDDLVKEGSIHQFTRWYNENACAYVVGIGELFFKPDEFVIVETRGATPN